MEKQTDRQTDIWTEPDIWTDEQIENGWIDQKMDRLKDGGAIRRMDS
jgi:hypothetical protein